MDKRVILIVLDSVGVGELPDAENYEDVNSHTLGHIAEQTNLILPNLQDFGLGNIVPLKGVEPVSYPLAHFGKAIEQSKGKDTSTGHWEIAGLINKTPFPTYTNGFPEAFLTELVNESGYKILCNRPYSGTEVINDFGDESISSNKIIIYTSADPVLQIAAHEESISLEKLYWICELALELSKKYCPVARVIARPFVGSKNGEYFRTKNRKDFSIKPDGKTVLDKLSEENIPVIGVGKISDIFAHQGITKSYGSNKSNNDGVRKTIEAMKNHKRGLIFTNLVDFDSLYGHRRDVIGYANCLMEFDENLPRIIQNLLPTDYLIITADHGCDPTFKGTDHTREYIPLLVYNSKFKKGDSLGIRNSFADIGSTIEEYFLNQNTLAGQSFLNKLS